METDSVTRLARRRQTLTYPKGVRVTRWGIRAQKFLREIAVAKVERIVVIFRAVRYTGGNRIWRRWVEDI